MQKPEPRKDLNIMTPDELIACLKEETYAPQTKEIAILLHGHVTDLSTLQSRGRAELDDLKVAIKKSSQDLQNK